MPFIVEKSKTKMYQHLRTKEFQLKKNNFQDSFKTKRVEKLTTTKRANTERKKNACCR